MMAFFGLETAFWSLPSKHDAVFTQSHQPLVVGHRGIPRATALRQRHFVMNRVRHFVFPHVCTCVSCLLAKVERTKARGMFNL